MAEGLAKKLIKEPIQVISRGLSVEEGLGPNSNAVRAMAYHDVNIKAHLSKQFDVNEVEASTIVLTMTRRHKEAIRSFYPKIGSQVKTIAEFVGMEGDVKDPYGQSQACYDGCAKQLKEMIKKMTID